MTSKVIYKGELRTECTHIRSSNIIQTDAPIDNQGKGETFSPTDLVATALASCILTIMGIKARDKGISMEGATAEVIKEMGDQPRRISAIRIKIIMPDLPFTDKEKLLLQKAADHCPVGRSLHPDLEEDVQIIWAQ